jgi:outer membrane protein OmpA-like peptidoglycan-associated protein
MQTALVTGADRHLGLELTRQLLSQGWRVCAGKYDKTLAHLEALQAEYPDQLTILPLDCSSDTSVAELAAAQQRTLPKTDSPKMGIKTNLLYDATATINLGIEVRTGEHTSLDLSGNYNNWSWKNDRKWKHYLVQPEFRWWPGGVFDGHFLGAHAHWALFNFGHLPHTPFSEYMATHRLEGSLVGAGVSYGYRWNLNRRWALEATIGMGYAHMDYDEFLCGRCGEPLGHKTANWFGPTKAGLSLVFNIGERRETAPVLVAPLPAPVAQVPQPVYAPVLRATFLTPEVEAVKTRSESGSAYLEFVVGRSEILSEFRGNRPELQKIYSSIELVKGNPDITITGVRIVGHASPEGGYDSNMKLSVRRAASLGDHLRTLYGLADVPLTTRGEGEDWEGLDSLVEASNILEKYRALEIIRSTDHPDRRESRLKALDGGSVWRRIIADYYPHLRRSDYKIIYTVVPFTVEKGREVLRTRPGDLSLNEMFLVAATLPRESADYKAVFETAARIFPDSDVANLNAAAIALEEADSQRAAQYLDRVKVRGEAWYNNMGMLWWLVGDKQQAAQHFANGGLQGRSNANQLEKHIRSINQLF